MRKALCALCGREAEVGSYCEKHWLQKQELFSAEGFTLIQCGSCGRWFYREWRPKSDLLEAIRQAAVEAVKSKVKLDSIKVSVRKAAGKYQVTVGAAGKIPPAISPKEEEKTITVAVKEQKCPMCVKILGKYHEAVIQLRGKDIEGLADRVSKLARGMEYRFDRKKEGYNLYFVSKADARKVAAALRKKGFEVTESYKLVGKKDGKELWKDFYSIRQAGEK